MLLETGDLLSSIARFEAAHPALNAKAKAQGRTLIVVTLSFSVRPTAAGVQTLWPAKAARLFGGRDSATYASCHMFGCNEDYYSLPPDFQLEAGVWTNVTTVATGEYASATIIQEGFNLVTHGHQATPNIWGII
ncbi:hypothetical protein PAXINDRAFT_103961 [Paxillus involutus ATCC 200175]|uniref:Uncharacterized protein n=1 Tax=Paxillus involutus ATCC 200175 TaxID=664439 RepID=A0A0C9SSW4_PAXIN|nr:hypothetical protein PAXINDRAFT_103961 [Paxillus involutus ATCC 200175]